MKLKILLLCMVLLTISAVATVHAAPRKVYVAGVTAAGVANRDEMQLALQTLLTSRLSGDLLMTVGSVAEAEIVVTASYIVMGKNFSLDGSAVSGGKVIARAFVQGNNADDLIPSVGKLAEQISAELAKFSPMPTSQVTTPVVTAEKSKKEPVAEEIVTIVEKTQGSRTSWSSQPLAAAMNLITAGAARADGSRDVFVADNRRLYYYRKNGKVTLIAEKELGASDKIISLDALDAEKGSLELYLTVVRNEKLVSQIVQVKGDSFRLIADGLPYLFRVIKLPGLPGKLYAQKVAGERTFVGKVFEAERKDADIVLKEPLSLPIMASINTFNQFADAQKNLYTVVISPDNKLVVFDREHREVWRSGETYGGSELFVENWDINNSGDLDMNRLYLNQRIHVAENGTVLVGKNEMFWLLGKKGNYKNGSVYGLAWNGDHLAGKWHTRISESYMPDFFFDEKRNELLQLEIVGRPHILSRGSTILTIRKIE